MSIRVGVLGGGQLGRMLALAGYPLGMRFRFLDPTPDAPAGQVGELMVGSYDDPAVLDRFAAGLDVVTYEFENVPVAAVTRLAQRARLNPPPRALEVAQDRVNEKTLFRELGIPTPEFAPIDSAEQLRAAASRTGLPAVLKTRRLGYDGKGQAVVRSEPELERAWDAVDRKPSILEAFVPFARELSILAVRAASGAIAFYPLVENVHADGILRVSRAPAPGLTAPLQHQAEAIAGRILERLGYVGVLAVELFDVRGTLVANEIAPRVHNSGHWTIEGAACSQFENHLRAIAGLPLGSAAVRGHWAMINLIGTLPDAARILTVPGAHLHLYGKDPRPGRKLGHITAGAPAESEADAMAARIVSATQR